MSSELPALQPVPDFGEWSKQIVRDARLCYDSDSQDKVLALIETYCKSFYIAGQIAVMNEFMTNQQQKMTTFVRDGYANT